jgi:predicted MFS family arabinose efflux permease
MFAAGLLLLAVAKIVFDVGLISWTSDHVAYERRSRVVGIIETSWALGLLVGVTTLGLVAAATSWRWSYVLGAVAVVAAAVMLLARLDPDEIPVGPAPSAGGTVTTRLRPSGWAAVTALFALMAAAQALFVTFGAWLEDVFGFGTAGLAGVTFGIGALELLASSTSAARTDRWGKERSVIWGAGIMVPSALVLSQLHEQLAIGLLALGLFIAAFEFSIVSAIPIGAELVPGAAGQGIGTMIACGTLGRAVTTVPATRLYERFGMAPVAMLSLGCAAAAGAAMVARRRLLSDEAAPPAG